MYLIVKWIINTSDFGEVYIAIQRKDTSDA